MSADAIGITGGLAFVIYLAVYVIRSDMRHAANHAAQQREAQLQMLRNLHDRLREQDGALTAIKDAIKWPIGKPE